MEHDTLYKILNEKQAGRIMMLCGALNDLAEICKEDKICKNIKKIQQELEDITTLDTEKNAA